jgi:hypothetical protein
VLEEEDFEFGADTWVVDVLDNGRWTVMPTLATGKMLFYISDNFCQRQKIKGRLARSQGGFGGRSRTS